MAELLPPSVVELNVFQHRDPMEQGDDNVWAERSLQMSTDLFFVVTGATTYPDNAQYARVYRYGIIDLAVNLFSRAEHSDEINNPFTGERIGSYNYTKAQVNAKAAAGQATGIYWWDLAVGLARGLDDSTSLISVSSEFVMNGDNCGAGPYSYVEQQALIAVQEWDSAWLNDPYTRDHFGR